MAITNTHPQKDWLQRSARLMRAALIPLCLLASPALAQDAAPGGPRADTSLIEACLENVSIAAEDGAPFPPSNCIGLAAKACMEQPDGSSTAGMVSCSTQELEYWDKVLNTAYQELVIQSKAVDANAAEGQPKQADRLRDMQRKWIAFRDASCAWEIGQFPGGSIQGPVSAQCDLRLTAAQALRLQDLRTPER